MVIIIDELKFTQPKTKDFTKILGNLKIDRSCLVSISQPDVNIYKSARNVPGIAVVKVTDLNAGDICNKQKMLFTKEAFLTLIDKGKKSN
jgi:large subunit ribosomal protein L4